MKIRYKGQIYVRDAGDDARRERMIKQAVKAVASATSAVKKVDLRKTELGDSEKNKVLSALNKMKDILSQMGGGYHSTLYSRQYLTTLRAYEDFMSLVKRGGIDTGSLKSAYTDLSLALRSLD